MKEIDPIIFEEFPKTYMEILKAHNREVQFANALAFFFRPNEKHGLKTLFIDSLLNTHCTELLTSIPKKERSLVKLNGHYCNYPNEELVYNADTVKVRVEVPTDSNKSKSELNIANKKDDKKRIDILIETETFTICIEFKINHHLDNPLKDYHDFITANSDGKRKYFIILTPNAKKPKEKAEKFINENPTIFKQVILSHFFETINNKLPSEYKTNENYQYFTDFLQTVNNRKIRFQRHNVLESLNQEINETIKCELHSKGFLEIKNDYDLKIRIITKSDLTETISEPGWQIEKWVKNKKMEILKNLESSATFDEIIKEIKLHLNSK